MPYYISPDVGVGDGLARPANTNKPSSRIYYANVRRWIDVRYMGQFQHNIGFVVGDHAGSPLHILFILR